MIPRRLCSNGCILSSTGCSWGPSQTTSGEARDMQRRALISVSNKRGIAAFARRLHRMGFGIISTGGTAKVLEESRIPGGAVSEGTEEPGMLGDWKRVVGGEEGRSRGSPYS